MKQMYRKRKKYRPEFNDNVQSFSIRTAWLLEFVDSSRQI